MKMQYTLGLLLISCVGNICANNAYDYVTSETRARQGQNGIRSSRFPLPVPLESRKIETAQQVATAIEVSAYDETENTVRKAVVNGCSKKEMDTEFLAKTQWAIRGINNQLQASMYVNQMIFRLHGPAVQEMVTHLLANSYNAERFVESNKDSLFRYATLEQVNLLEKKLIAQCQSDKVEALRQAIAQRRVVCLK